MVSFCRPPRNSCRRVSAHIAVVVPFIMLSRLQCKPHPLRHDVWHLPEMSGWMKNWEKRSNASGRASWFTSNYSR